MNRKILQWSQECWGIQWLTLVVVAVGWPASSSSLFADTLPGFASGIKIGEVTTDSAMIWVRLTDQSEANFDQLPILSEGLQPSEKSQVSMPENVAPGIEGSVRLQYWKLGFSGQPKVISWHGVEPASNSTYQFEMKGLDSGTNYEFRIEGRRAGQKAIQSIEGRFITAPALGRRAPVRFIVSTCQAVRSIDDGKQGHISYQRMLDFNPMFFVHTGDIVYYDKVPLAKTVAQARAKWDLMFSYGHNRKFHQNVASYFMKDDHDTLKNDCWPGQEYGDLKFDEGLALFREQVPMGDRTYRTFRWGKDLQIWLTENRDFRSENRMPDGPEKTILGAVQKTWLMKTLKESDATFKFVISPGPLVGPDKKGKNDNHSNPGFETEGRELREFLASLENCYVICGDRHWQYCSQDPKTDLIEMGCGPINDQHKFGGNPGRNPRYHRYFSAKGGFLGVTIDGAEGRAEWFGTNQDSGGSVVLHTETLPISKRP